MRDGHADDTSAELSLINDSEFLEELRSSLGDRRTRSEPPAATRAC